MIALFFDTETTGFPSTTNPPEIVQIGALLQDLTTGRVLSEVNLIVQASKPIPQVVIDVHGITDELSATYGVKQEVADHMFALMASKADVLIAHNIDFDTTIVDGTWAISPAIIKMKQQFCTMRSCAPIAGIERSNPNKIEYAKLAAVYRYFFKDEIRGAHDAMIDVRACRDVFMKLLAFDWYRISDQGIIRGQYQG